MKHLDLFSGIGGFALAARWAGFETTGFCEIDKYAQKVLKKNFPGVPIYEDVTKLNGSQFKDIYLLTGGFPCQDISIAGKGAGIEGKRSGLWSELFRIISEVRPKYALIENVPALTFRGGTRVIGDLTEIGYDCEWQIVGADHVGARHRRRRIWIVAYPHTDTVRCLHRGSEEQSNKTRVNALSQPTEICEDVAHSQRKGLEKWKGESTTAIQRTEFNGGTDVAHSDTGLSKRENQEIFTGGNSTTISSEDVAYSNEQRLEGFGEYGQTKGSRSTGIIDEQSCPNGNHTDLWLTEPSVGRVVNGLPNRVDRLKGLGNAIVPQVAYEIMRCLK